MSGRYNIVAALKYLLRDRTGLALVEFALTAPILILLFVGGYQLTDAVSAYRKLTITTRTVADLTSQYTAVTSSDLSAILNASQQVMAPYDASDTALVVSQVTVDEDSVASVDWSSHRNGTALEKGDRVDLPADIRVPGTSLIVAQTSYNYSPKVAPTMFGSFVLRDQIVMSPRLSDKVEDKR